MNTDSPGVVVGHLGLLEDELAGMQQAYVDAAGWMAGWEHWHRREYLRTREGLIATGVWEKGTTETQKKDDIEFAVQAANPGVYDALELNARAKAIGDKLFASIDSRRSIGQSVLKTHLADEPKFGQGAR